MSHASATIESRPQDERRKLENLRQTHEKGLSDQEGAFLYHVLKNQMRNGFQGVTQDDIFKSGSEADEPQENRLKKQAIAQLASKLQRLKWDNEDFPYLVGDLRAPNGKQGYGTAIEVFATVPRTIKVALEAQRWKKFRPGFEGQIRREDFVKDFSTSFRIESSAVERAIDFLIEHKYLYEFPGLQPPHFRPNYRLQLEMEYLRRAERLFQPGIALPESELTESETDLLIELWKAKHLAELRGLTAEELKARLTTIQPSVEMLLPQLGTGGRNMLDWDLTDPLRYRVHYWVLQWPPDAQLICDLLDNEEIPLFRKTVIATMSTRFQQPSKRIEIELLKFAKDAGYIADAPANPGRIVATRRAKELRPFLERIGQMFDEWKEHNREGKTWQPKEVSDKPRPRPKGKRSSGKKPARRQVNAPKYRKRSA